MVSTIVNAPLSASGTVKDARVGINVYLQSHAAPGAAFMDPAVIGYGIPAGGRMEMEMGDGFARDWDIAISQSAIMMVTGRRSKVCQAKPSAIPWTRARMRMYLSSIRSMAGRWLPKR